MFSGSVHRSSEQLYACVASLQYTNTHTLRQSVKDVKCSLSGDAGELKGTVSCSVSRASNQDLIHFLGIVAMLKSPQLDAVLQNMQTLIRYRNRCTGQLFNTSKRHTTKIGTIMEVTSLGQTFNDVVDLCVDLAVTMSPLD